jgi:uncharacterized protein YybS (DUF2232 family)
MKTANIIGLAGSVILMLSIFLWIPVIGPIFSLILPLPFLFYTSKMGLKEGIIAAIITFLAVAAFGRLIGQDYLVLFCIELGIAGILLAELFKRHLPIGAIVLWGTASVVLMGVASLCVIGGLKGQGMNDIIQVYLQTNIARIGEIYDQSGLEKDKLDQIKQALDLFGRVVVRIYPSLIIVGTGFVVWMNVVLSRPLFRVARMPYPDLGAPDRWHAPEMMVWGIIAAGFGFFLPVTGIRVVAENLIVVLSVIYLFHGLSIMLFFFNKHSIPRWARTMIYLLVIIQQLFLVLLAVAGLFDQWVDFRRLHKRIDPESA